MGAAYKFLGKHFSMIGISLLGALTHNLTQLLVAAVVIENLESSFICPYAAFRTPHRSLCGHGHQTGKQVLFHF